MSLIDEIKKSATESGAKIQTTDAKRLEGIINAMFYLDRDIEEECRFLRQVMTRGQADQERKGLHASAIIVGDDSFCLRQQVLSLLYKQLQGEEVPIPLKRIFEEGNAIHEKIQRLFIRAGYAKARTLDLTRFDPEYQLSYSPDIVCRIPQFYDGAMIGEIKSVNPMQFKKMTSHPSAHKQLQLYMHLCIKAKKDAGKWNGKDYLKGFVLCEDKGGQDFKIYIYDYDPEFCEPYIKRLEKVKDAYTKAKKVLDNAHGAFRWDEEIFPRRLTQCTYYKCKMSDKCPMRDACWDMGMGRIEL